MQVLTTLPFAPQVRITAQSPPRRTRNAADCPPSSTLLHRPRTDHFGRMHPVWLCRDPKVVGVRGGFAKDAHSACQPGQRSIPEHDRVYPRVPEGTGAKCCACPRSRWPQTELTSQHQQPRSAAHSRTSSSHSSPTYCTQRLASSAPDHRSPASQPCAQGLPPRPCGSPGASRVRSVHVRGLGVMLWTCSHLRQIFLSVRYLRASTRSEGSMIPPRRRSTK